MNPCPRFPIRGANLCESLLRHTPDQLEAFLDRMVENRMNTLIVHVAYGFKAFGEPLEMACRERDIGIVYYLQTSLLFLKGISPDLFAKDRGGRVRTPLLGNETRLCVSDPRAQGAFRHGVRRYFETLKVSARKRLAFIDSDGYLFCQCPSCDSLGPVEQWMVLYRILLEEGQRSGKDLAFWYLSYVWRYQLPRDMTVFEQVEAVLFDTHQRCRWAALGEEHALTAYNDLEALGDSRAASIPLNCYLVERLAEWRRRFGGKLIVFENLMLQGSISCPQPYTPQLLRDLDYYESCGLDGVIYEAFEPGIESFSGQLRVLCRELVSRSETVPPPTALEAACHQYLRCEVPERFNYKNQFNVLSYLTTSRFDGLALLEAHRQDPVLTRYATLLRAFLLERTSAACVAVVEYVLLHKQRFDWIMIGFNLLRAVEPPIQQSQSPAAAFLAADKLWDWMEEQPDPLSAADEMIRSLVAVLRATTCKPS